MAAETTVARESSVNPINAIRNLVEMRVNYLRKEADGTTDRIETTMDLVIARNAAGAYTYSSFSDTQLDAAGEQD